MADRGRDVRGSCRGPAEEDAVNDSLDGRELGVPLGEEALRTPRNLQESLQLARGGFARHEAGREHDEVRIELDHAVHERVEDPHAVDDPRPDHDGGLVGLVPDEEHSQLARPAVLLFEAPVGGANAAVEDHDVRALLRETYRLPHPQMPFGTTP